MELTSSQRPDLFIVGDTADFEDSTVGGGTDLEVGTHIEAGADQGSADQGSAEQGSAEQGSADTRERLGQTKRLGNFGEPEHRNTLAVTPWLDPVIDKLGYDPRSAYVERFWLGTLGPSTTWLMRRLASGLDSSPDGFELNLEQTARAIGLGGKVGRHGPFQRSISRLAQFELGRVAPTGGLAVRRFMPPLPRRHVMRLDPAAQEEHRLWSYAQERPDPEVTRLRWRARRLALGLISLGAGYATVETELLGWHLHPALASDATSWAWRFSGHGRSKLRDPSPVIGAAVPRPQSRPVTPPSPFGNVQFTEQT
jgi:hypothetical protein